MHRLRSGTRKTCQPASFPQRRPCPAIQRYAIHIHSSDDINHASRPTRRSGGATTTATARTQARRQLLMIASHTTPSSRRLSQTRLLTRTARPRLITRPCTTPTTRRFTRHPRPSTTRPRTSTLTSVRSHPRKTPRLRTAAARTSCTMIRSPTMAATSPSCGGTPRRARSWACRSPAGTTTMAKTTATYATGASPSASRDATRP